ncbi:MAG: hypothetical protein WCC10_01840 [Tumebacillaceae bacterium]
MEANATEPQAKPGPVFPTKAKEELYWFIRQLIKLLTIIIVLGIVLWIAQYFSPWVMLIVSLVGLILILATGVYCIGHLVRFLIYTAQRK